MTSLGASGLRTFSFALSFAACVVVSLFVSFVVTPMLASRWYRKGEDMEHPTGRFAIAFEKGFGKFESFYRSVLEWALKHRWFVFLSGNVALFAVFQYVPAGSPAGILGVTRPALIGVPLLWAAVGWMAWHWRSTERKLLPIAVMAPILICGNVALLYAQGPDDALTMVAHLGRVMGYLVLVLAVSLVSAALLRSMGPQHRPAASFRPAR